MKSLTKERIPMADWVKAFAIYLVVVSHTAIARPVAHWAFMVEIPLFFFMSGYLFRFRSNPSFSAFAKKRFRQIIIPYITINTVTYLFWLLATRRFNADNAAIPAWQPLVGIITCRSTLLHHNATMYFFTALFNIEILYYLLFRKRNFSARCLITLLLAMLGAADYYLSPSELPFSISHTLVGIVFYSLGYELRCSGVINTFMNSHSTEGILTKAFAATVFFAASLLLMHITGPLNLQKRIYDIYPLYFVEALLAVFSVITVLSIPSSLPQIIRQISANTLCICGYHLLVFTLIKGFMIYIAGIPPTILDSRILPNILFSLAAMLICLCFAIIIKSLNKETKRFSFFL